MPEHPEIRAFASTINKYFAHTVFTNIKCKNCTERQQYIKFYCNYQIQAYQRGKQLKLVLSPTYAQEVTQSDYFGESSQSHSEVSIIIGFGLSGYLSVESLKVEDYLLSFRSQAFAINLKSKLKETVYFHEGDFDKNRGPDPIEQFDEFRKLILYTDFYGQYLCDILMKQRYFNGVGNYLRSEIIFRSRIPYCYKIHYLDEQFVNLVRNVIAQAFSVSEDPEKFKSWLYCYGKAPNAVKDKNGRTVWFFNALEDKEQKQVIQRGQFDEKDVRYFILSLKMQ